MQWTEDISVGVPMIDNRHKELVNRLTGLRDAIKKQVCKYTIDDVLAFLEEYVKVHFCEEEQFMKYYGYPDYATHKEKHENLVMEQYFLKEELLNIRALGLKGSYELSVETVQVLADWLRDHIMTYDRKLGDYLMQHSYMNSDEITSPCKKDEPTIDDVLTVCSLCHKMCDRNGAWRQKDSDRAISPDIVFSHGICPECLHEHNAGVGRDKRS